MEMVKLFGINLITLFVRKILFKEVNIYELTHSAKAKRFE